MAEPADMIVPLLREMRAEITEFGGETRERFDILERRFKALEDAQASFKHALTADSLLSRLVTAEFEGRSKKLEQRVRELERQT